MTNKLNNMSNYLLALLSFISLFFALQPAYNTIYAEDDKTYFTNEAKKIANDDESFLNYVNNDKKSASREEDIGNIFTYLFTPGGYIENVSKGVLGSEDEGVDSTVVHEVNGRQTVCYFNNEPQNLLNHNCDVPAFGSQLWQSVVSSTSPQGIQGAEMTTAQSEFGIPSNIPTGTVPANQSERKYKYTGLELWGYDLRYTTYLGEWDNIQVNTQARMMANFGFWSKAKLTAATVGNGLSGAINAAVNNFSWNPIKYVGNIIEGAVSNSLWTIMDTSDLNVIATHAWGRPQFSNTLYNAYYMSNKEVVTKAQNEIYQNYLSYLQSINSQKADIKKMLDLSLKNKRFPSFKYKGNVETAESKAARRAARKAKQPIPKKVFKSRKEEFQDWLKSSKVSSLITQASEAGWTCSDKENYGDFLECWDNGWNNYARSVANNPDNEEEFKALNAQIDLLVSKKPHYNPNRAISHYVCANEDGEPIGETMADWKYIYTKENSASGEYLNSCSKVRPSIEGALFGTGDKKSTDTRYLFFKRNNEIIPVNSGNSGIFKSISIFFAKLTNTLISFSYSNILEALGIDKIISTTISSLRDSIFYPFATIGITLSLFWILIQSVRMGFGRNTLMLIIVLLATYAGGIIFLTNPAQTVKLVEEVPSKVDNYIMDIIVNDNELKERFSLCSTNDTDEGGARSMACIVWKLSIFDPWVYGQWGTDYYNLDSDDFTNTNSDLVGTGTVNLGGGIKVNNWAAYQLEITKTGSITNESDSDWDGLTTPAIYKLVDLQAGPKNGAASDDRYFASWAGLNNKRGSYQVKAAIISIVLFFLIGSFAILKIEYTLLIAIQVFFLPLMFALGLYPGGKIKIKDYLMNLLNLYMKRFLVVLVMSLTLYMLTLVSLGVSNYNNIFFTICILAFTIKLYYKDLINLFSIGLNSSSSFLTSNPKDLNRMFNVNNLPPVVNTRIVRPLAATRDAMAGAVGGAIAGTSAKIIDESKGMSSGNLFSYLNKGIKSGAKSEYKRTYGIETNQQRRKGLPFIDTLDEIENEVNRSVNAEYRKENSLKNADLVNFKMAVLNRHAEIKHNLKVNSSEVIRLTNKINNNLANKVRNYNDEHELNSLVEKLQTTMESGKELESQYEVAQSAFELMNKIASSNFITDSPEVNQTVASMIPGSKRVTRQENDKGKLVFKEETITTKQAVDDFFEYAPLGLEQIRHREEDMAQVHFIEAGKKQAVQKITEIKEEFSSKITETTNKLGLDFNDELIENEVFWITPEKTPENPEPKSMIDELIEQYKESDDVSDVILEEKLKELKSIVVESQKEYLKEKKEISHKKSASRTIMERFSKKTVAESSSINNINIKKIFNQDTEDNDNTKEELVIDNKITSEKSSDGIINHKISKEKSSERNIKDEIAKVIEENNKIDEEQKEELEERESIEESANKAIKRALNILKKENEEM